MGSMPPSLEVRSLAPSQKLDRARTSPAPPFPFPPWRRAGPVRALR